MRLRGWFVGLMIVGALAATPAYAADSGKSFFDSLDQYMHNVSEVLKIKKAAIEIELQAVEGQEWATTQSQIGQLINDAVGTKNFVPATKPQGTIIDTLKRIGIQLYLYLLVMLIYIVDHPVLRYIALAIIALILIRFVVRLLRH